MIDLARHRRTVKDDHGKKYLCSEGFLRCQRIAGQCLNIKPLDPRFRLTGRAFTILYGPSSTPSGTVGDYIDDVPAGSVVEIASSPEFDD